MESALNKSTLADSLPRPTTENPTTENTLRPWPNFVGIGELFFLVVILGVMQLSQGSMLDDPGLGWHIRNIDAMIMEGGWLTTDPFNGPRAGAAWYTNQWLGDGLLYAGWQWGGLEGIAAVTTLVLALTFYVLYQMLLADRVPAPLALGWTYVAAMGTSLSWVARPNILTLAFVMITAWTVDRYHRGACTRRQTLWLIPLFAVWANTHGGFVAGLIILAATVVIELVLALISRRGQGQVASRQRAAHLSLLFVGAALATLLNPYGWKLYTWVFQLLGNSYFMNLHTEWLSPDFHSAGALRYELLMLALPLLLAFGRRRRISLVALALSLMWLHFALQGVRYVALWVVVSIPLLARLSADLLRQQAIRTRLPDFLTAPSAPKFRYAAIAVISIGLLVWSRYTDGYARHAPEHIPVGALSYVLENHHGETVFHEYGWGGWLIWHGWPGTRSWIDDRNEVQGQPHTEQYFAILHARSGWQCALRRSGARVACIPPASRLASVLADHPNWTARYRDRFAVVFVLDALDLATPPIHHDECSLQPS